MNRRSYFLMQRFFFILTENLFAQKISVALDEALEKCPNTKIILVPSVDDPLGPQM